ncbi:MAG TPA: hypothetical protein PKC72_10255 [Chitinophagaceae bacterium]|nr:hypothetical protein [Chitinophagaceae bacterium]
MKTIYMSHQFFFRLFALLILLTVTFLAAGQKPGTWEKYKVEERMTDLQNPKDKCLPKCSFSGKSDDMGMNFEFSYTGVDKKTHVYRGHVAWEWKNSKGPGTLIPGEIVTIKGIVSNLTSEYSRVTAYATFGTWGFMKSASGKSGDETAKPNGSVTMIGSFNVPKQPGLNKDGSENPYLRLTFTLSGGNQQRFVERTIIYKWTPVQEPSLTGQPKVTDNPAAVDNNKPIIETSKPEFKKGELITVKFKNLPGFATDWIGIYGSKAYHANEYIEWKYTNGLKEGTITFQSPRYGAGEYMIRVYENNGYKLLAQSIAFKVVD